MRTSAKSSIGDAEHAGISLTRRVLGIGWLVLCGIAYEWSAIVLK
jgi:hypothetical protein